MVLLRRFCFVILLAALPLTALADPEQIILLRHAEKPDDPDALHLSTKGQERAKALVKFFTENKKATRYGPPVALYATRSTKHGRGQRPRETLQPLADKLKLAIQCPYESEDYEKLAREVLANPAYKGKTVVICWTQEYLPVLASALRVEPTPDNWKSSIYDRTWIINYSQGKASLDVVWQKLLPGDNKYKDKAE